MELDTKIQRIKELISIKENAEAELNTLITGTVKERKKQQCEKCGSTDHNARNCDKIEE